MRVLIAGDGALVETLEAAIRAHDVASERLELGGQEGEAGADGLADALERAERLIEEGRPDGVLAAGEGGAALAAAIAAAKLQVPLIAVAGGAGPEDSPSDAREPGSRRGRAIMRLAIATVPPDAERIAARLREP